MLVKTSSTEDSQVACSLARRNRKRRARTAENGSRERAKVPRRQAPPVVRPIAKPEPDEDSGLGFDEPSLGESDPPPSLVSTPHAAIVSSVRVSAEQEDASDGFVTEPQTTSQTVAHASFLRGIHQTSRCGRYRLELTREPESRHRARYQTEGSRGAVKDSTGKSSPQVMLRGYTEPCELQMYVGSDADGCTPHLFYQACRVTGKTASSSRELLMDGTVVIETTMIPEPSGDAVSARCDCLGILKQRNVDIETRVAAAGGTSSGSTIRRPSILRKVPRTTSCRLVFRVAIVNGFGETETLQIASRSVICTQPQGVPEVTKLSLLEAPCTGGAELIILGKNFVKDSRVVFSETTDKGNTVWSETVCPQKEHLQAVHLVCSVPTYWDHSLTCARVVSLSVRSGDKESDGVHFAYLPVPGAESPNSAVIRPALECGNAMASAAAATATAGNSRLINGVSKAAIAINRRFTETGQIRLEARKTRHPRSSIHGTARSGKATTRRDQPPRRTRETVYLVACPVVSATPEPANTMKVLTNQASCAQAPTIGKLLQQSSSPLASLQQIQCLNAGKPRSAQTLSVVDAPKSEQAIVGNMQQSSLMRIENLQPVQLMTQTAKDTHATTVEELQQVKPATAENLEQTQVVEVCSQQVSPVNVQSMQQTQYATSESIEAAQANPQSPQLAQTVTIVEVEEPQSIMTESIQQNLQLKTRELPVEKNIIRNQAQEQGVSTVGLQLTAQLNVEPLQQTQPNETVELSQAPMTVRDLKQTMQPSHGLAIAEPPQAQAMVKESIPLTQVAAIGGVQQLQQVTVADVQQTLQETRHIPVDEPRKQDLAVGHVQHWESITAKCEDFSRAQTLLTSAECSRELQHIEQHQGVHHRARTPDQAQITQLPESQQQPQSVAIVLTEPVTTARQTWPAAVTPLESKNTWPPPEQTPCVTVKDGWLPTLPPEPQVSQTQSWSERVESAQTWTPKLVENNPPQPEQQWPEPKSMTETDWSQAEHTEPSSSSIAWTSKTDASSTSVQVVSAEQPVMVATEQPVILSAQQPVMVSAEQPVMVSAEPPVMVSAKQTAMVSAERPVMPSSSTEVWSSENGTAPVQSVVSRLSPVATSIHTTPEQHQDTVAVSQAWSLSEKTPATSESWATTTGSTAPPPSSWSDAPMVSTLGESPALGTKQWPSVTCDNPVPTSSDWTSQSTSNTSSDVAISWNSAATETNQSPQVSWSSQQQSTPATSVPSLDVWQQQQPVTETSTIAAPVVGAEEWTEPAKPVQPEKWAGDEVHSWSPEQIANVLGDPVPVSHSPAATATIPPQQELIDWPEVPSSQRQQVLPEQPLLQQNRQQQHVMQQPALEQQQHGMKQPLLEQQQQQSTSWDSATPQQPQHQEAGLAEVDWKMSEQKPQETDEQQQQQLSQNWSVPIAETADQGLPMAEPALQDNQHNPARQRAPPDATWAVPVAPVEQPAPAPEPTTLPEWTIADESTSTGCGESTADPMWSEAAFTSRRAVPVEDPLADMPKGMGLIEYINGDHE